MRDIPPRLNYLRQLIRRQSKSETKEVNLGFIKDAIITQMQPFSPHNITDIDIGEINSSGDVKVKIFYSKEKVR